MKITALLDALNSALAEPFALAWSQDSPRFLLVFTVIYAVAVIVAVSDQKNTRPGAEHGSAAWGDVFRLNKFYMDKRGPNLLLTQHFHIGIDGYKHKHNTNILIVGGSGAGKTRTYGVPNVLECACSMVITDPKSEILRKTGNLLKQKGYEVTITSQFGHRVDPITGEVSSHTGTDIACAEGTPILAAADGIVTVANGLDSWGGSYGYYIQINHGGGLETLYAHCSSICVTTGQQVQAGQVIGYVGHTGRATGSHLHLETRTNGTRVDSMQFFS